MKHKVTILCLVLASMLGGLLRAAGNPEEVNVYSYRMKGKVRLLFFWVGKDDVGGGTITISKQAVDAESNWSEEVEVLFGSNPDRVPGSINRWGYGRETSVWSRDPEIAAATDLRNTLFEGFMKHSKEESLSEVQKNNDQQKEGQEFQYDGIRSIADGARVAAEIRTFSTSQDFRYQDSAPVHCGYRERLKQRGPDRTRALDPLPTSFKYPFGFLTGVRSLIRDVLKNSGDLERVKKTTGTLNYAYNGREYRLELKDTELVKEFELTTAEGKVATNPAHTRFQDVAKTEFRITNLTSGEKHDFTLWFPLKGQFRGIPLRIVDKPRWWLRIELNLEPETKQAPPRANIDCSPAS